MKWFKDLFKGDGSGTVSYQCQDCMLEFTIYYRAENKKDWKCVGCNSKKLEEI